ncbi:unnamed protein product [Lasius platythorax]|uniref:Uncharacterized protein n=1 Tax=Lasius platythorax TaxID=488582 RepID=A0AAV2P409_9HYME
MRSHEDVHCGPGKSSPTGNPGTKEGQAFRVSYASGISNGALASTSTRDEGASGRRACALTYSSRGVEKSTAYTAGIQGWASVCSETRETDVSFGQVVCDKFSKVNELEIVLRRKEI